MQTSRILQLLVPGQAWRCTQRGMQSQTPRMDKALRSRSFFGESGYILLVIPATTFCLGCWQVKRRRWKLGLIEMLESKTQSPPVPLPLDLDEVAGLEYRPVTFRGEFDHSGEMLIGPRSNVLKDGGGLISSTGTTGVNIITPMKLADREETILVNRGWVSQSQAKPRTRKEGQIEGVVEVTGIVRLQEERTPFMPTRGGSKDLWLYRDVKAMAEEAGTAPIFVDLDYKSTVPGGPMGGQTRVTLRNEHMSYIITWFTLSAFTFYIWYRRYHRPPPPATAFDYMKNQHKK